MNPLEHADYASRLLAREHELDEELAAMSADRRLELAVTGATAAINADRRWTVELAIAHALTAIALRSSA